MIRMIIKEEGLIGGSGIDYCKCSLNTPTPRLGVQNFGRGEFKTNVGCYTRRVTTHFMIDLYKEKNIYLLYFFQMVKYREYFH